MPRRGSPGWCAAAICSGRPACTGCCSSCSICRCRTITIIDLICDARGPQTVEIHGSDCAARSAGKGRLGGRHPTHGRARLNGTGAAGTALWPFGRRRGSVVAGDKMARKAAKTSTGRRKRRTKPMPRRRSKPRTVGGRGHARRSRARHPHAADRHSGVERTACHCGSGRARARLGRRGQEHRRASDAGDVADRRCGACGRQGPGAAARTDASAPACRGGCGARLRPAPTPRG